MTILLLFAILTAPRVVDVRMSLTEALWLDDNRATAFSVDLDQPEYVVRSAFVRVRGESENPPDMTWYLVAPTGDSCLMGYSDDIHFWSVNGDYDLTSFARGIPLSGRWTLLAVDCWEEDLTWLGAFDLELEAVDPGNWLGWFSPPLQLSHRWGKPSVSEVDYSTVGKRRKR